MSRTTRFQCEADWQYSKLLQGVMMAGHPKEDRTGVGTISTFGRSMRFNVGREFPIITLKRVAFRTAMTELVWMLRGRTDATFLQERGCHIWDDWADEGHCARFGREEGDLGPVYGHQWRSFGELIHQPGFDQLAWLMRELRENPTSRRLIVTAWNPHDAGAVAVPPCPCMMQFVYCQHSRTLSLLLFQRSADMFLGVPFDMCQYAALLVLVCWATPQKMRPGELYHVLGDAHVYMNHVDQVATVLEQESHPAPKLTISPRLRGGGISAIMDAEPEDFKLSSYRHGPTIKAPVAV